MSELLKRLKRAGLKPNDIIEIDQKEFEKELRWLKIMLKRKEKHEKISKNRERTKFK